MAAVADAGWDAQQRAVVPPPEHVRDDRTGPLSVEVVGRGHHRVERAERPGGLDPMNEKQLAMGDRDERSSRGISPAKRSRSRTLLATKKLSPAKAVTPLPKSSSRIGSPSSICEIASSQSSCIVLPVAAICSGWRFDTAVGRSTHRTASTPSATVWLSDGTLTAPAWSRLRTRGRIRGASSAGVRGCVASASNRLWKCSATRSARVSGSASAQVWSKFVKPYFVVRPGTVT